MKLIEKTIKHLVTRGIFLTGLLFAPSIFLLSGLLPSAFLPPSLLASAYAGSIYTCTGPDGKKTFSDRSCDNNSDVSSDKIEQPTIQQSQQQSQKKTGTTGKGKSGGGYRNYIDRARSIEAEPTRDRSN